MRVRILGAAATGAFPQWNCSCGNCRAARSGRATSRSQTSIAVNSGDDWFLLQASLDVRAQIETFSELHPRSLRDSPIAGVVVLNADGAHGLAALTGHPLVVHATPSVLSQAKVDVDAVRLKRLVVGERRPLIGIRGDSGLTIEAIVLDAPEQSVEHMLDHNVAVLVRDPKKGAAILFAPSVSFPSEALAIAANDVDAVFFDGRFWRDEELIALDLDRRTARDLGHWPLYGDEGSLRFLAKLPAGTKKILVNVSHTNPMLSPTSRERTLVEAAGVDVGYDGLELPL